MESCHYFEHAIMPLNPYDSWQREHHFASLFFERMVNSLVGTLFPFLLSPECQTTKEAGESRISSRLNNFTRV